MNKKVWKCCENQIRYRTLRDAGLCVTCKTPSPGFVRCLECRKKGEAYRREVRERLSGERVCGV